MSADDPSLARDLPRAVLFKVPFTSARVWIGAILDDARPPLFGIDPRTGKSFLDEALKT